jgi:two-component system, OmpR family, aerobic respiration control sensor histidine kinase ArcB
MKKTFDDEIALLKKHIEKQRAEISQLKTIIDDLPGDVYWKHFADEKLIYSGMNYTGVESLQKMGFKWRKEDILGKSDGHLFDRETAQVFLENDLAVIHNGIAQTKEETAILPSGKKITQLSTKRPLFDKQGKIVGISGVSINISGLKEAQHALQIALEKAEIANQAKTEFLENMRHDLRTPLTGIVGCAHLIKMQSDDPKKVSEYVDDLVASSDALTEFLNKILESIAAASGEIPLLRKDFNLKEVLEQIIRLNQSQATVKGLELSLDYGKNIPVLRGDAFRAQRILLELVTNALKYTDHGAIKVSARLAKKKKHEVIIEFRVQDTGMGIPKDKHNDIYTRFTRLIPSAQGMYPGTGLGLSVIKQFIQDLNGEIHVNSEVGQGTTFICLIPFQKSSLDKKARVDATNFKGNVVPANKTRTYQATHVKHIVASGSRVLVVEDNTIAAKVARNVLTTLGCEVDVAIDGRTALAKAEANSYDLILMDVGLPDADGCEVTRQIRLKPRKNSSIPIIGLTAHIAAEKKQHCLANGMNAVYTKPLTSEKLVEILKVFIPLQNPAHVLQEQSAAIFKLEAVLDLEQAEKLVGNKRFVKECLVLLIKGLTEDVQRLKHHHKAHDWLSIKNLAHKWQGGASYCGANRLIQACQQLDSALGNEPVETEKVELLYQHLLQVIKATQDAVNLALANNRYAKR